MKNLFRILLACFVINSLTILHSKAQTSATPLLSIEKPLPWKADQLMEPIELAAMINNADVHLPVILNIGAVEDVKDARHIGPINKPENMEKFKAEINSLPKNTPLVIYCGCCPFSKCPNIRPAFLELTKAGFTNIKVLNLPKNLATDWTAKGYPLAAK
jgi:rhodanese-related sulfurtransferase